MGIRARPVPWRARHVVLVDCLQRLMPALGGGDDVFGVGFPDEGAGLLVVVLDEAVDGLLQADQGGGKVPRFRRRRVSLAKKPSTAFSQKHEVGVKWKVQRGLLRDRTRPSRIPAPSLAKVAEVIRSDPGRAAAWRGDALDGARDGDRRAMAAASGVSLRSVQRIWAGARPAAAPGAALQAVHRSGVRRQARGHRRPVRRSAGAQPGALGRREVAMCGWPPARKRKVSVWHNQVALRSCVRPHMRADLSIANTPSEAARRPTGVSEVP